MHIISASRRTDIPHYFSEWFVERRKAGFSANTSASVDRRGSLRWSDFAKIHVLRPSIEEQQAIVRVFETANREPNLLRTQLDALREQKKGLMQQLLTGKVRVKV